MKPKIFVISDTHFGHKRILDIRPFASVEEMDAYMIKRWNETVTNDDLVFHLGDFAFSGAERIREVGWQLNGQKFLVTGNHDRTRTKTFWARCGFEVLETPCYMIPNYVLSHEPLQDVPCVKTNIHGHIHDYQIMDGLHLCVSVECTGYKPLQIRWTLQDSLDLRVRGNKDEK